MPKWKILNLLFGCITGSKNNFKTDKSATSFSTGQYTNVSEHTDLFGERVENRIQENLITSCPTNATSPRSLKDIRNDSWIKMIQLSTAEFIKNNKVPVEIIKNIDDLKSIMNQPINENYIYDNYTKHKISDGNHEDVNYSNGSNFYE
jgi:hypothetical protein